MRFPTQVVIFSVLLLFILPEYTEAQDTPGLDELEQRMVSAFPGDTEITVQGAFNTLTDSPCMDAVAFEVDPLYRIPQTYPYSSDAGPRRYTLYAHTLVASADNSQQVFPAEIRLTLVKPNSLVPDLALPIPIIPGAIELIQENAIQDSYLAEAEVTIQMGQDRNDTLFIADTHGDLFFELSEDPFVDELKLAFDFQADSNAEATIQVEGIIYNVRIPWFLSYDNLPDEQNSYLTLSGLAYATTGENQVSIEGHTFQDQTIYDINIETVAVPKNSVDSTSVPLNLSLTVVAEENVIEDIRSGEIWVDGEQLTGFSPHQILLGHLNINEGRISGELSLAYANDCSSYLAMEFVFRDIPLN